MGRLGWIALAAVVSGLVFLAARADPKEVKQEAVAAKWIEGLRADSAAERLKAIQALLTEERAARPHVRAIAKSLRDSDERIVNAAARLMEQWHYQAVGDCLRHALPELGDALSDKRVTVRLHALRLMGFVGPLSEAESTPPSEEYVAALAGAISDSDARVCMGAIARLNEVAHYAKPAVPEVVKLLAHNEPRVGVAAFGLLLRVDPSHATRGERFAEAPSSDVRLQLARTLGGATKPISHPLRTTLHLLVQDETASVREAAINAMIELRDGASMPLMIELAEGLPSRPVDPSRLSRGTVLDAMQELATDVPVDAFELMLQSKLPRILELALATASYNRYEASLVVPRVAALLTHHDERARVAALYTLTDYAAWADAALPQILKCASSPDTRGAAIATLSAMAETGTRDPRILAAALDSLRAPKLGTEIYDAIRIVKAFGPNAKGAAKPLRRFLVEKSKRHRHWTMVFDVLPELGNEGAELAPLIVAELDRGAKHTLQWAAALASVADKKEWRDRGMQILLRAAKEPHAERVFSVLRRVQGDVGAAEDAATRALKSTPMAKFAAELFLLRLDDEWAKSLLSDRIREDETSSTLDEVEEAGAVALPVTEALIDVATNSEHPNRGRALRVLGKIGAGGESVEQAYRQALTADAMTSWYARVGLRIAERMRTEERSVRVAGATAAQWASYLSDKDPESRRNVINALYHLELAARPHVREIARSLGDSDQTVREHAFELLKRWQYPKVSVGLGAAMPEFLTLLQDARGDVRALAIEMIFYCGANPHQKQEAPSDQHLELLIRSLSDTEESVRTLAARCIENIAPYAKKALPALRKSIQDKSLEARLWALHAAYQIDPSGTLPLVIRTAKDPDGLVRCFVAKILQTTKEPVPDEVWVALEEFSRDSNDLVRNAALRAAVAFGGARGYRMIDNLAHTGNRPRGFLRSHNFAKSRAAETLGEIGHVEAVPTLTMLLEENSWIVVHSAAISLGALGPDAEPAIPALAKLLRSSNEEVRKASSSALSSLAPFAQSVVPSIIEAYDDVHSRSNALPLLAALVAAGHRNEALLERGIRLLDTSNEVARMDALSIVREFGTAAGASVPALRMLLDANGFVPSPVYRAVAALGQSGEALAPLLKRRFESTHEDWWAAGQALAGVTRDKATRARVIQTFARDVEEGSFKALIRLGQIGGDLGSALPTIRRAFERPSRMQTTAALMLLRVGGADRAAAESFLRRALTAGPDPALYDAIAEAGPVASALAPELVRTANQRGTSNRLRALRALRGIRARGPAVASAAKSARLDSRASIRTAAALLLRDLKR